VPKILKRIRALTRRGARPVVRPSVPTLHSLRPDDAALMVINLGKADAHDVTVTMQLRHATFEFDTIDTLPPNDPRPLTRERVSRFRIAEAAPVSTNWFRIAVRSVVSQSGDLRIPLAIRYFDDDGSERATYQTLHCNEMLAMRVSER
jgi:hypothetical protein